MAKASASEAEDSVGSSPTMPTKLVLDGMESHAVNVTFLMFDALMRSEPEITVQTRMSFAVGTWPEAKREVTERWERIFNQPPSLEAMVIDVELIESYRE
jgi:hypothetical protein